MFTDMVGYTALGQRNESLSLALVEEQRKLIRPLLATHNGREIKTMGDAFMVEFPSALDAARCAYDIQRAAREANMSLSSESKIHLRIGIHSGDVVEQEGDISGDAVNVASRIEPLTEDGGVCMTRPVYEAVRNKIDVPLVSLGARSLKNVIEPMEIYKMELPWEAEAVELEGELDSRRLAVLPFVSLSPDPTDEYFADGLTEELIDRLCQIKEFEVIARTSVMSYKRKEAKATDIGRELRAGSLVEGSMRKVGNKIRVTAQLVDANTDGHLWSSRYDREIEDIFSVQAEIAEQVASALAVRLRPSETKALRQKRTGSVEAYSLYLKGRQLLNTRVKEAVEEALERFNEAKEVDPSFALAYVGIADSYKISENWGALQSETAPKAKRAVLKALELDGSLPEAHTTYGVLLAEHEWRWAEAELQFKRALELNPNYATAHHWYAFSILRHFRRVEEEMRESMRAVELDPLAPIMSLNMGQSLYMQERYSEAVEWGRRALEINPNFIGARLALANWYGAVGKHEEALRLLDAALPKSGYTEGIQKVVRAMALGRAGRSREARRLLSEALASQDDSIPPSAIAEAWLVLGEVDEAYEKMELALHQRDKNLLDLVIDPISKPFRSDSRFQELKREIGL